MEKTENIFELLDVVKKNSASDEEIYLQVSTFLEQEARRTGTPYHGHFELTPLCNLNCKMCYVHLTEAQIQGKKLLSADTWIALMQQAIDAGMVSATLSGGECLTYPQFDKVFHFLKSRGINVSILTNGVLLDHDRIEFFKHNCPSSIQVTLYGCSEDVYEFVTGKRVFSIVLKNIQDLKNSGIPIRVTITPNKYMGDNVKKTIQLVKDLDVPYSISAMLFTPRKGTGRENVKHDISLDDYVDIHNGLNEMHVKPQEVSIPELGSCSEYENTGLKCGAGKSGFCVYWDGSMHPCIMMDSVISFPMEEGFLPAWERIKTEARTWPSFKKCEKCVYERECNFCSAENARLGSKFRLNPIWCERMKKMHGIR